MTDAGLFRFLHVLGVVLWLGVALTLALLVVWARRSGSPDAAAFAYRANARLMKALVLPGMLLTVGGGFALNAALGYGYFQPFPHHWLFQMQVWGVAAFVVGVLYQVPLSERLARAAEASAAAGEESAAFTRYRKRNAIVSSLIGLVLVVVVFLGTVRP